MDRDASAAAAQGPAAPTRGGGSKLAAVVADRLVADIAARGWPEGEVVGSEAQLLKKYKVSRAVFREAVRLVEHMHVARMRRGPGGGLVVMPPSVDSVTDAVSVYLFHVGATIDEVFEARLVLEEMAAELAPDQLEEADIAALRDVVAREASGGDPRSVHRELARITGNPALEFFVDLLNQITFSFLPTLPRVDRGVKAEASRAHEAIVDAVVGGSPSLARKRMRVHLEAEAAFLRKRRPSRRHLADLSQRAERSDKLAEKTAVQILAEVAESGWPVGELLGSEVDLQARYGVSRAVLREAVRVLEHHQVARMRRGPGGGLFVTEPEHGVVADSMALQLDRLGIKPKHLFEVRTAIEMVVLDRVIARRDDDVVLRLERALEAEQAATRVEFVVVGHDIHNVLAELSENRVLELLSAVLLRLSRIHSSAPAGATDPIPSGDVTRAHTRIVEAIVAGDDELARHRMRRHLEALVDWVR